jgi:hypothetical protein
VTTGHPVAVRTERGGVERPAGRAGERGGHLLADEGCVGRVDELDERAAERRLHAPAEHRGERPARTADAAVGTEDHRDAGRVVDDRPQAQAVATVDLPLAAVGHIPQDERHPGAVARPGERPAPHLVVPVGVRGVPDAEGHQRAERLVLHRRERLEREDEVVGMDERAEQPAPHRLQRDGEHRLGLGVGPDQAADRVDDDHRIRQGSEQLGGDGVDRRRLGHPFPSAGAPAR